jgi:enoyl-CoA hydratase
MALIRREDRDGIASLILNRPEKLNAISRDMLIELREHLERLAVDETVGCVVVSGAGRCFGAGHDLGETGREDEGEWRSFDARTIDLLEQLPQPTIAKVHGYCFTGSLELALACDLLVAAESAQFADTHGERGLVPIWGMSVRLPERIGMARAKDLSFTSRRVAGSEALAMGLVDRCFPDDELDGGTAELARQITVNSPGTNRMTKALHTMRSEMSRSGALAYERTRPFGLPADRQERR